MRVPAILPVLCLTLTPAAAMWGQKAPPSQLRSGGGSGLYYYVTPPGILDSSVHTVPADDQARFDRLESLFAEEGCSADRIKVQPLGKSHSDPGNLICTWPADSASSVVVLAEYQHQGKGQSAVENWSGAVLLPYLYSAMQARPRENNWVFVESGGKSGAADYLHSLTGKQRKQIRAMVVLTSLGVSPTLLFYSPDTEPLYLPAPLVHLQMTLALAAHSDREVPRPRAVSPFRWLAIDDTQPFRYIHVPSIVLHSIPDQEAGLPGSLRDTASAIDANAYYLNYRAVAVFLAGLDELATKLSLNAPIWHGQGGEYHLDPNDLPRLR